MLAIVASTNPVKQRATLLAFQEAFGPDIEVKGVSVASGVSHQPLSDVETFRGAQNRARNARDKAPGASFWVGIEGGVADTELGMEAFGWAVIYSENAEGLARSNTFFLPPAAALAIRAGGELGPIMDELFGQHDTKQKGGAIGLLTNGIFSRQDLYQQMVLLALIPFLQPDLYNWQTL
ncbi:MAG: inosine/xanthosine triphosphatase [Lewinellaceae bacterium]|nr:inosine/xanthosine triphosphatase [Lewinellaceae bacterium]